MEVLVSVAYQEADRALATEQEMNIFCKLAYDTACGVYGGLLPFPIERQTVSARSNFRMTLDPSPYCNPNALPMLVAAVPQAKQPAAVAGILATS